VQPVTVLAFEKVALGKSAVVKGQSAAAIEKSLKEYKAGTLNKNGMGAYDERSSSFYVRCGYQSAFCLHRRD
jgi:hypothetical protein